MLIIEDPEIASGSFGMPRLILHDFLGDKRLSGTELMQPRFGGRGGGEREKADNAKFFSAFSKYRCAVGQY